MPGHSLFFTAQRSFEAARRLSDGGADSLLHGHGFRIRAFTRESDCRASFPGDEAPWLGARLDEAVAALDYGLLNEHIEAPDDARIAEWVLQRSNLAGGSGLALGSAPDRGVVLRPDGQRLAWRRFRFEAAHRLPNVPADHKCGRMHGHGFETVIYAAMGAGQESRVEQARIAESWREPHRQLHLACLNDLEGLDNPTSEVLASWIWERLGHSLHGLAGITVMETASAGCHYDGHAWRIWKEMPFDSAVRLARAPDGDARRLTHGHTFAARLHLSGGLDETLGWIHDYGDVKRIFDPVFRALDHQPLYEHAGLTDCDPASVARYIDSEMAAGLPGLCRVDVLETPGCGALLRHDGASRDLPVP